MKKMITILALGLLGISNPANAQESFGNTLNIGVGAGYYRYTARSMPVISANYEFDVAKNFTLAPFISFYSYDNRYYWNNKNYPSKYYGYRETVVPIGVKGSYYFDKLLRANSQWDFYLAGSAGFAFRTVTWDGDYYGDRYAYRSGSGLYLDIHLGAEYHVNKRAGLFFDLSSGVSTFGLALHM